MTRFTNEQWKDFTATSRVMFDQYDGVQLSSRLLVACEGIDELIAERDALKLKVERLIGAGEKLVEWFDDTFAQACSNGLFDAWNRTIKCTLLNEGSHALRAAIDEARE